MLRIAAATVLGLIVATPALAVEVRKCADDDYATDAAAIAEPWERNTRAFYNGSVRVAVVDTGGEPVCCSTYLLILAPDPQSEDGSRACFLVNDGARGGFAGIDFAHLTARYDAGKGLLITFPYSLYNEGNPGKGGTAHVRVNVVKGTVEVE